MKSKRFSMIMNFILVPLVLVLCLIVHQQKIFINSYFNDEFRVYLNFQNMTNDYMEFSQVDKTDSHFQVSPAGTVSLTQLGRTAINNQTKLYIFRQEVRYDNQTFSLLNNTFNLYLTARNNKIVLAEIVKDSTFHSNFTFTAEIVDDTTVEITIS